MGERVLRETTAGMITRLKRENEELRRERLLLAMLASVTPQFDNPLVAWEAQALRDRVLASRAPKDQGSDPT